MEIVTSIQLSVVSIHAPREGCDYLVSQILLSLLLFQFTHPGRGATQAEHTDSRALRVSIHAPREGCDLRVRICFSLL